VQTTSTFRYCFFFTAIQRFRQCGSALSETLGLENIKGETTRGYYGLYLNRLVGKPGMLTYDKVLPGADFIVRQGRREAVRFLEVGYGDKSIQVAAPNGKDDGVHARYGMVVSEPPSQMSETKKHNQYPIIVFLCL